MGWSPVGEGEGLEAVVWGKIVNDVFGGRSRR